MICLDCKCAFCKKKEICSFGGCNSDPKCNKQEKNKVTVCACYELD